MERPYKNNIEKITEKNRKYRKILYTNRTLQLVAMALKSGEKVEREIHKKSSQFIRIERGKCKVIIRRKVYLLRKGDCVIIPPNHFHTITNTGKTTLKFYTIYSPPVHK